MNPVCGPALGAAALLAAAGVPKLRDPSGTAGALRSVGWPAGPALVRVGAAAEIAVGAVALAVGGPAGWALVATAYAGFAVFLAVALRLGGAVSSCGCVGRPDTPPSWTHLGLTAGLSAVTAVAAGFGVPGLGAIRWTSGANLAVVAYAAVIAWLSWAVIALLPGLRPPVPTPAATGS